MMYSDPPIRAIVYYGLFRLAIATFALIGVITAIRYFV